MGLSCTNESSQNLPIYSLGLTLLSTATKSGRQLKPCSILPMVDGKEPPPCANATRSFGRRSNTPPNIIEQIASDVSAGIPTNQGSQYFVIFCSPIISQGCTNTAISSLAQASKTGNSSVAF